MDPAQRDEAARLRDELAALRDEVAARRDAAARLRGSAGAARDKVGAIGDDAADERDRDAEQRDRDAEQRDRNAEDEEAGAADGGPTERGQARTARGEATSDRRRSKQDRRAAAAERTSAALYRQKSASDRRQAAIDRDQSSDDRGASAGERTDADVDRHMSSTNRATAETELQAATLDALTGAHLRGPGLGELEREIARATRTDQPLTVAFLDVDHLKAVNDTRGHAAGDRLLVEVAATLRAMLRPYDLIVRVGGDEFVCALAGLSQTDASQRMSLLSRVLAAGPEHGSVTVGVAQLEPGDSLSTLVERADAALYATREQQRMRGGQSGRSRPQRDPGR